MKSKVIILVLVIVLLLSQVGYSNTYFWFSLDGNKYLELPESARRNYVVGLYDMWNYMHAQEYPNIYKEDVDEVMEDISLSQIIKVFEKFLEEHPEYLHWAAPNLFDMAIKELIFGHY